MTERRTQDFRELQVWQRAYSLALSIYEITATFPRSQRYGLADQMQRRAVSIGANIAEGCGRGTQGDLARFLGIALGSSFELRHYLSLGRGLGYLRPEQATATIDETVQIGKMLTRLKQRVLADEASPYDPDDNDEATTTD